MAQACWISTEGTTYHQNRSNSRQREFEAEIRSLRKQLAAKDNVIVVLKNPSLYFQKHIGRYLGRPVIATSRIDNYDGDMVTFHYNRHEDDKLITETLPVLEFIEKLIQHIPEKHFKMIRYYGLYSRHRKEDKKLQHAVSKEKHKFLLSLNRWRNCICGSFGYDPIQCPCCKNTMVVLEIYHNHKRVSLDEMYERVISRHRLRPT